MQKDGRAVCLAPLLVTKRSTQQQRGGAGLCQAALIDYFFVFLFCCHSLTKKGWSVRWGQLGAPQAAFPWLSDWRVGAEQSSALTVRDLDSAASSTPALLLLLPPAGEEVRGARGSQASGRKHFGFALDLERAKMGISPLSSAAHHARHILCAIFPLLRVSYIRFLVGGAGQGLCWAFPGAMWKGRGQSGRPGTK